MNFGDGFYYLKNSSHTFLKIFFWPVKYYVQIIVLYAESETKN